MSSGRRPRQFWRYVQCSGAAGVCHDVALLLDDLTSPVVSAGTVQNSYGVTCNVWAAVPQAQAQDHARHGLHCPLAPRQADTEFIVVLHHGSQWCAISL
ncbi:hypothetical protein NDU88_004291 [Pleurodeles waltl]|uniref:Uncharacterized protein n=1 Tax=Pleurodeles waltl TaxID=8319 RepID=A0AAV7TQW6_PLEWA|nr:hypothetical protein NDU88_004291 [Pleurodeles waltl]